MPFSANVSRCSAAPVYAPTDFTTAAEASVNAVVHVKVVQDDHRPQLDAESQLFNFFFGPGYSQPRQAEPVMSSGSGVIISPDGYIVTNNHVIDKASRIEVVLNDRRSFVAELVGTDPTTDIALLKIDADSLQALAFGNSDALRVGEWVLAVGNPFNLTSTVTAGIVSAKSRSIGIIAPGSSIGIESFIQTDAAVNPGNSGGALVNTRGELVGINTAIASRTGSYSGYSFAVPSDMVQKVAQDLRMYGEVQRALLGVSIAEVTPQMLADLKLDRPEGVAVMSVSDGSGAKAAGVQVNDVIVAVDGEKVNSVPALQEKIGRRRPGDSVKLDIKRAGKAQQVVVTLRNIRGTTGIVKVEDSDKYLGATFAKVPSDELRRLRVGSGIKVKSLAAGKLKEAGVREGFIIVKANRMPVSSAEEFAQIAASASEGLFIAGVYPNGKVEYYAINLEE